MYDDHSDSQSTTRRTILRTGAGAAALAAVPSVSAHEYSGSSTDSTSDDDHDHSDGSLHGATGNAELLNYHSLGALGPASESGSADSPHYGGITELRVHGDYAYVSIFSSDDPTNDRGLAVVDISEFNAATSPKELRNAEFDVVSFLRNDDPLAAVMDVKVSDDGDYVFISKQPYTALFEETDPTPGTDGDSASASASALQAVDVTDPANPTVVGTYDAWTTGPHNATYHVIDGTEYLFATKDLNDGSAGLYVFQFDRLTGALALLNVYTVDGDLLDTEVGTGGTTYIHDITVQDDPRLDRPVGYLSYWDAGLFALDLSDPTDIEAIGHFSMSSSHYAEPAPVFLDGKRIVVAGQEIPSRTDGSSGKVYLVDADGLDDGYTPGEDNMTTLDEWEWQSNVTFADFTLSPHNFDVTDGGYVHLGHYHGGTRFLDIDTDDWTLSEKGYFRAAMDVPESSKMEGLNHAAPFAWTAVQHEGVTYISDVNTGVYAVRFKPDSDGTDLKTSGVGVAALGGAVLLGAARRRISGALSTLRGAE